MTDEFRTGGWSADYPTKSLDGWQQELAEWEQALLVEGKASRGAPKNPAKKKK